jgi:hypothetical protein
MLILEWLILYTIKNPNPLDHKKAGVIRIFIYLYAVNQNENHNAALKLFNTDGIVNVRLQHIADEALFKFG